MLPSKKTREIQRANNIVKTFGPRAAAGYLYRRGWSLSSALWIIARATLREGYIDVRPL